MEGDAITMQDLFVYDVDEIRNGGVIGSLRATGLRPTFTHKLERHGVRLPVDAPAYPPVARVAGR